TFTTSEALHYMAELYGPAIIEKGAVLRNIVPEWPFPELEPSEPTIVYVGRFNGRRQPDALLEGLAAYNSSNQSAPLSVTFVGTGQAVIERARQRFGSLLSIRH